MIEALTERLERDSLPATVFCTHRSPAVDRLLALDGVETALHPNFLGDDRDEARVLRALHALFPLARGLRNHVLYHHSRLLPLYHQHGLRYISNDLSFLQPQLSARYDYTGMVRLPIFWEDDVHSVYFDGAFDLKTQVDLRQPGLKVFSFHPVHLYLNTARLEHYSAIKSQLTDQRALAPLAGQGVATFFEQLVAQGAEHFCTLDQLATTFAARTPYRGAFEPGPSAEQ